MKTLVNLIIVALGLFMIWQGVQTLKLGNEMLTLFRGM